MKIVFMGTPEFAVPCLDALIGAHDVKAVFTQPDRPKGRGKKMAMSAVKERALEDDIPVYQPEKINKSSDDVALLKALSPDVIVVVAYGQLLSQEILDIPKYGCINVHASLLPKYRGAAPINFAILNGEKVTGLSTMYLVKKMDAGDVLDTVEVDITENMTAGELHDTLSPLGGELILTTLRKIENGTSIGIPQDEMQVTYASIMNKDMAVIDWSKSATSIHNLIRGFNPWPVATTLIEGQKMKVFASKIVEGVSGNPGVVQQVSSEGILIDCGKNQLLLTEIQMPNKKRMSVASYILGNSIESGIKLGV